MARPVPFMIYPIGPCDRFSERYGAGMAESERGRCKARVCCEGSTLSTLLNRSGSGEPCQQKAR